MNYFAVFEQLGLKGVPNVFKMRAPPYKASLDLLENTVESVFDLQMGWGVERMPAFSKVCELHRFVSASVTVPQFNSLTVHLCHGGLHLLVLHAFCTGQRTPSARRALGH